MHTKSQTAKPRRQRQEKHLRQSTECAAEPTLGPWHDQPMRLLTSGIGTGSGSAVALSGRARWWFVAVVLAVVLAAAGCVGSGSEGAETLTIGAMEPTAASQATDPTPAAAETAVPASAAPARPSPPSPPQSQGESGQEPGSDNASGPVGNGGGEGEASDLAGVLPGSEDVPGGLWVTERPWGRVAVADEIYDLCDDAQAFAVAMDRHQEPGEEITPEIRRKIEDERQRWKVSCDVEGGNRYIYLDIQFNYPSRPSVEELLGDPKVAARIEAAEYRAKYLPPGTPLGYRGVGSSISNSRIIWEDEGSQVEVEPSTLSVIDGTVRGLVANRTRTLFARNVTVTVQEKGAKTSPATGSWPLTIQPAENAPFEVTGWTGSTDPQELEISVTADLSPLVDLSRSYELEPLFFWQGKTLEDDDYRRLVPAQVINTQDQEIPAGRFVAVSGSAYPQWPSSHPSLKEKFDTLTFDDLRAYAAFFDSDRRVVKILKLATYTINESGDPYTVGPVTAHEYFHFNFIVESVGVPEISGNFAVWVGNANKP